MCQQSTGKPWEYSVYRWVQKTETGTGKETTKTARRNDAAWRMQSEWKAANSPVVEKLQLGESGTWILAMENPKGVFGPFQKLWAENGSSQIIFLPSVTCSHPMTEVIKTRTLFTFNRELCSRCHLVLLMHEFVLHFRLTKDLSKPQWVGWRKVLE